jgi:hypothetical protein
MITGRVRLIALWICCLVLAGAIALIQAQQAKTSESAGTRSKPTTSAGGERVPCPLGFYTRGMDGHIDEPSAGWKGRGLLAANNNPIVWQTEGGAAPPASSRISRFVPTRQRS